MTAAPPRRAEAARRVNVFVSYRVVPSDREACARIAGALTDRGVEVHGDWELRAGPEYEPQLRGMIRAADALVFLLSPDSVASPNCHREVDYAARLRKLILPVLIAPGVDAGTLRPDLAGPQWTRLRPSDDFALGIDALVAALETDYELTALHTRLTQRAEDWRSRGRPSSALLARADVREAVAWLPRVAANARQFPAVTPLQQEFITASEAASRRTRAALLAATFGVVPVVAALALFGTQARARATQEASAAAARAREARARELSEAALASLASDPEKGLWLAAYAVKATTDAGEPAVAAATDALHRAIAEPLVRARVATPFVQELAASPDGRWVAAARYGDVTVWRVGADLQPRDPRVLRHPTYVSRIAFSPDGRWVATAGQDGKARVWDPATGALRLTVTASGALHAVSLGANGRIATAGFGADVWDSTGAHLFKLTTCDDVEEVAFSVSDGSIATSCATVAQRWDSTGAEVATLGACAGDPGKGFYRLAFHPDGRSIVGVSHVATSALVMANDATACVRRNLDDRVAHIAFSRDGRRLATLGGGAVKLWSADYAEVRSIPVAARTDAIAFLGNSKGLAVAGEDGLTILELEGDEVLRLGGDALRVAGAALSPDGERLSIRTDNTSGSAGSILAVLDLRSGGSPVTSHRTDPVEGFAFSGDGTTAVYRRLTSTKTHVYDVATGTATRELDGQTFSGYTIAFSLDGRYVAMNDGGTLHVHDTRSGKDVRTIYDSADARINPEVTLDANGGRLAATARTGIEIWRVDSGRLERVVSDARRIAFNPAGQGMATTGGDSVVAIRNGEGSVDRWLRGHTGEIMSLAFSGDGARLATGSRDSTVRVWDVASGATVATLRNTFVPGVAFSRDGRRLAVIGGGEVGVYALDPRELLTIAARRARRPLAPVDCERYLGAPRCPPLP